MLLLKQSKLFLVPKRVGNPQLCIPTHSEVLAYISFQFLLLLKNALLVFLSSNPLRSWAFMPTPRTWAALLHSSSWFFPTQQIFSTKGDQISWRWADLSSKVALSNRQLKPCAWSASWLVAHSVQSELQEYWPQCTNSMLDLSPKNERFQKYFASWYPQQKEMVFTHDYT